MFTHVGSTWVQGPKLTGAGEIGRGGFGRSVALSGDGDTAVIGGGGDDGGVGAAWVFTRVGSTWVQQGAKLTGVGESGSGDFGIGVAISEEGDTLLVGGARDEENTGAAWVFTLAGGVWSQQGEKLTGADGCGTPLFGTSVALSGDGEEALIGAPYDCDRGAIYLFTRSGTSWSEQGPKITVASEVGKGSFGQRVALSADGETALAGAFFDNDDAGAAWVFTHSGSTWVQQGPKLTAKSAIGTRFFGNSVALSADGEEALIGGAYGDTGFPGAAWVFTRSGTSWTQGERVSGSGEAVDDLFGANGSVFGESAALSADGATALVGGGGDDDLLGSAWVFASQPASSPNPVEYGRCQAVPGEPAETLRGEYPNGRCAKAGMKRAYEWSSGVASTRFTTRSTGTPLALQSAKGEKVTCAAEAGTGEYSGSAITTVGDVIVAFTGCELQGERCSTAQAAEGEIVTRPLEGVLGVTRRASKHDETRVGLELLPEGSAGAMMEFSCGGVPVSVRGSLIAPLQANAMLLTSKLDFTAVNGKQRPEGFVGQPKATLEASFGLAPFERAGLSAAMAQTNEEAVEVRSQVGGGQAPKARRRRPRSRA